MKSFRIAMSIAMQLLPHIPTVLDIIETASTDKRVQKKLVREAIPLAVETLIDAIENLAVKVVEEEIN